MDLKRIFNLRMKISFEDGLEYEEGKYYKINKVVQRFNFDDHKGAANFIELELTDGQVYEPMKERELLKKLKEAKND